MLLYFNAVVCVLVTAYKFTSKLIAPLFFLHCMSHYGFVMTYRLIVTKSDNAKVRSLGKSAAASTKILTPLYLVLMLVGTFFLSKCSESQVYPWSFVLDDLLFFASYFLVSKFNFKTVDNLLEHGSSPAEKDSNTLVLAQFKAYFGKFRQMAIWRALELVLGRVFLKHVFEEALTCEQSSEWHYKSIGAHLFLVLHILGTVQALGVQSEILVKTVKGKKAVTSLKKDD